VQVLAPGELRVSEGRAEYTLRANSILVYSWVASAAQVDRWIEELTQDLTGQCSAQDRDWNARPVTVPGADVRALWSHVLREAARLRHGGAFVVVPDPQRAPIKLKHPTEPLALGGETGAANASPLTYADSRTSAPLLEEQLLPRFGHRHRSAFLLCKAVPNAIAFVISQDGDLPVFSSDDRHVYCDENLSP
jgi:hypothetical protein